MLNETMLFASRAAALDLPASSLESAVALAAIGLYCLFCGRCLLAPMVRVLRRLAQARAERRAARIAQARIDAASRAQARAEARKARQSARAPRADGGKRRFGPFPVNEQSVGPWLEPLSNRA